MCVCMSGWIKSRDNVNGCCCYPTLESKGSGVGWGVGIIAWVRVGCLAIPPSHVVREINHNIDGTLSSAVSARRHVLPSCTYYPFCRPTLQWTSVLSLLHLRSPQAPTPTSPARVYLQTALTHTGGFNIRGCGVWRKSPGQGLA